jgi:hypothetical protein
VLVPPDITLHQLHKVIQTAAGWLDDHLYEFRISGVRYAEPDPDPGWYGMESVNSKKTLLKNVVAPKKKLTYVYDFGDDWVHDISVETVDESSEPLKHPVCLDGARSFPPEDCGGLGGFDHLLYAIANPQDTEEAELREWAGDFDPESFSVDDVNAALKRITYSKRKP